MANQRIVTQNPVRSQDIVSLYLSGRTLDEIGEQFGISRGAVWNITQKAGARKAKRKTQLTDEIRQIVISDYRQGSSTKEISKRYDISQASVANILKRVGYDLTRKHLTEQQRAQIIALYETGLNTYEIGREIGFSNVTVQGVINKAKIPKHSIYKLTSEVQRQIVQDYNQGESSEKIAKRLNVRPNLILDTLKRNGITRRPQWPKEAVPEGQLFNPNYEPQDLPDCKFSGIYKFTNKLNGKMYIGQASNIYKRYYQHREMRAPGLFTKALKKYGIGNFTLEVLERVDDLNLIDQREQYWMDFYQCYDHDKGYNIAKIAGTVRGVKRPDVTERLKQMPKHGSANPNYGRKHSPEAKLKMSEARQRFWEAL